MTIKTYVDNLSLGASSIGPPSPEFLGWIASRGISGAALRYLGHAWIKGDGGHLGTMCLSSESEIMREDDEEPRWLRAGFLVIGSCGNGDMVAVELLQCPGSVWFMSHGELWGDDSADPRQFSVQVATDLADFVVRAWDIEAFPLDCYDAQERNGG